VVRARERRARRCPGEKDAALPMPQSTDEATLATYSAAMPGAVQVRLGPGDYALYRACGWHAGTYSPRTPRATLHDFVFTDAYIVWRDAVRARERRLHEERAVAAAAAKA
jgi:hypothetical protein